MDIYGCGDQDCNYYFYFTEKEAGSNRSKRLLKKRVADLSSLQETIICFQEGNLFTDDVQIIYALF